MLRFALLAAALALAAGTAARAEDKPQATPAVVEGVTVAEFGDIMIKAGYQAKVGVDSDNLPVIDSKASGMNFWVYLYNCEGAEPQKCRRVQFQSSFKTDKAMQDKALEWNNKKVAGRASNDKENTYFDYLIDCGGGVSAANLSQNLERFDTLMAEFTTYIGWR
ncbi:YbjN domain-containing protein [Aminobacter anthyllidis]|uniref:YbjN domain-containing protein n=1 Tax=Aminobacter anthyllidis TaxID=1035067 RepID=UPI002454999F|nr:YbjN domain-containing protein [Aminobacter anthyllidis]MDH4987030.1 YbjN domain-containing protein [Aminobacter anthyllidis]